MQYQVNLKQTEEGYAVWCPSLPGCASQGTTKEEALNNIQDAIQSYLEVAKEGLRFTSVHWLVLW